MTLPEETLATGAEQVCPDCRMPARLGVYQSAAGYYVGTYCNCGPYSRESGYFQTRKEAAQELTTFRFNRP